MVQKSRRRNIKRRNEGKTWYIADEVEGILLIETYSGRYGTGYAKMRRSDYENTVRYPDLIPGYTLDKVF